jgi:hypothetical protein
MDMTVKLDEQEITQTQLMQKIREINDQPTGQKIVEVAPGVWKTLTRLQG